VPFLYPYTSVILDGPCSHMPRRKYEMGIGSKVPRPMGGFKANSHIPCRAHTAPLPFPCHAVPLRVYIVSFPFDLHSEAVFDSHITCRARAHPRPCRSEGNCSWPRHSAAWAWHGLCELASTVLRRHVGNLLAFGFFRLPRGVPPRLLSEAYQSVKL
jgi:hypothetical protein